jgi:hypothetical protein
MLHLSYYLLFQIYISIVASKIIENIQNNFGINLK